MFMVELQSRGPLTATPPLFTPATQARWILVVGSPEFTESLITLAQVANWFAFDQLGFLTLLCLVELLYIVLTIYFTHWPRAYS